MFYLCPERRISFDGFVNYEGRRFGVPFHYKGTTARIMRKDDMIYSADLKQLLTTHDVTWSKRDRFCADQYAVLGQPEEFSTMPVKTEISRLPESVPSLSFEKFNFDEEVAWDKRFIFEAVEKSSHILILDFSSIEFAKLAEEQLQAVGLVFEHLRQKNRNHNSYAAENERTAPERSQNL